MLGQCKDMSIKFVNNTGLTISVPSEGHRVRNRGSVEGWNPLTLGGSIVDLPAGESRTTRQDLTIKCVRDADIEIYYTSSDGSDFTQVFGDQDLGDKFAVLTLTNS